MREGSSWRDALVKDLRTAGLDETTMPAAAMVEVELGLHFLARFFPGEPIGVLQSILSGYIGASPELQPVIRRVRHRMGDVGRRGWWRNMRQPVRPGHPVDARVRASRMIRAAVSTTVACSGRVKRRSVPSESLPTMGLLPTP